ncbi:putative pentatricopeptide repeat-containing protein At1g74580 [Hevea brasiliensis]|uniref:putative pentatricopeptide repeat-containing protein At1g74580 n=1 Tax=Hevea brasiliensis TaxID=3981 RepID=UPI0025D5429E|nr:putative pentatricopeptide repeat-containing protein At1g74580 [Hevea brasiliensis]
MFNSVKKEDGFKHTLLTYWCMIEKLGFHIEFEAIENVLMEIRMNVDNSLLEGVSIVAMRNYGRKGKVHDVVDVFKRMDLHNYEPSVLSCNAIMNILVKYGYFNQAHKVYLRMKDKKDVPDVYTFTIKIKSFCRTKGLHAASRLLNNMPSQGCELNVVAYCMMIGGFYEENYQVMKKEACPNLFTFNVFIQELCRKGALDGAINLLDSVNGEGLSPDVVTYNTLIYGLCKNSKVVEAVNYLHKMLNKGLEPDGFTYNPIIDGYCKIGMTQEADKILNDAIFKGFVPDEFTHCSLINGLFKDNDIDHALALFNGEVGKGLKPYTSLHRTLIKGLNEDLFWKHCH